MDTNIKVVLWTLVLVAILMVSANRDWQDVTYEIGDPVKLSLSRENSLGIDSDGVYVQIASDDFFVLANRDGEVMPGVPFFKTDREGFNNLYIYGPERIPPGKWIVEAGNEMDALFYADPEAEETGTVMMIRSEKQKIVRLFLITIAVVLVWVVGMYFGVYLE